MAAIQLRADFVFPDMQDTTQPLFQNIKHGYTRIKKDIFYKTPDNRLIPVPGAITYNIDQYILGEEIPEKKTENINNLF
jgi:hypothetical protein